MVIYQLIGVNKYFSFGRPVHRRREMLQNRVSEAMHRVMELSARFIQQSYYFVELYIYIYIYTDLKTFGVNGNWTYHEAACLGLPPCIGYRTPRISNYIVKPPKDRKGSVFYKLGSFLI